MRHVGGMSRVPARMWRQKVPAQMWRQKVPAQMWQQQVPAQMWQQHVPAQLYKGERSPSADGRCGSLPQPGADVAGASPAPAQMWHRGEPSPGADVGG